MVESPSVPEDPRAWVEAWAGTYLEPEEEDLLVGKFNDLVSLGSKELSEVIEWKFDTYPARRSRTHNLVSSEPEDRIREITRRAIGCNDDLGALLLICELKGVGPALGSAILMMSDPDRFTVIDTRALASLRALELLPPGPAEATMGDWLPYLAVCRDLAIKTQLPLRVIDRALYSANGSVGRPPVASGPLGS